MNKFLISFIVIFFCGYNICFPSAWADDSAERNKLSDFTSFSNQEFLNTLNQEIKNGVNDDILIELLLMTPYEKRQYIFPFIHEEPFLSHKLKSHPDILFWKNKKPTVIAPQLTEFSKKYLNDLPATLYPFLDPDFWNKPTVEKSPKLYAINLDTAPLPITRNPDYKYPDLKALFKISPELLRNYKKTDLTTTDIHHLTTVLHQFNDYAKKLKDPQNTQLYLRTLTSQTMREALADPFTIFVKNITHVGEKESFESFIQSHGFKDLNEFTDKADRLLKAYRAQNLNLFLAIQFNHIRADMPTDKKRINSTQMYARMYTAKPGDVYFALENTQELKKTFPKEELAYWGIPIYID